MLSTARPVTSGDALDAWTFGDPLFYPAEEAPADWLMVARVPGTIVLVPLAPPRSGDLRKCRPIGIHERCRSLIARYEEDSRR